jgi:Fe-S cluster assembly protein SufD
MQKLVIDLRQPQSEIHIEEDIEVMSTYIGRGDESVKSHLKIIHSKPNLKSRILIKAVVFDRARFDFEGLLRIQKGAVGTDSYLKIKCLVMSESAFARAVPSLEILESEVKGGHGATIGYLDDQMMHYLLSRGISKSGAEQMLVEAFIKD